MSKVQASQIGNTTFSKKEKDWIKSYRHTLIRIGSMPNYDCGPGNMNKPEKRLSSERFSTNYKTREEFDNDREIILNYLARMEYAPEGLVNKVAETVVELDLQFGE